MWRTIERLLVSLVLIAQPAPAASLAETRVEHAGVRFRVLQASPERVGLVWKNEKGEPHRTFDKVQAGFAKQGRKVVFLTNAGIFQMGGTPCGLHIENGVVLHPLNLADDEGNFFLKPNGVVHIETDGKNTRAIVSESSAFRAHAARVRASATTKILTAAQSGPLLLIDGRRHPAFREGSPNKLHRNGVGVDSSGQLVFAITDKDQSVNFWDFAGLFLELNCRNALFLDGDISKMSTNPENPVASNPFGAVFVITEPSSKPGAPDPKPE